MQRTESELERSRAEQLAKRKLRSATNGPGKFSVSSGVVSNKKAPTMAPWITKETLVYRHSPIFYLNSMSAVFDDVANCDAGFD
jgi:hypothetical protein